VEYDEGVILGADSRTTTGNSSTGINTFNDTKSKCLVQLQVDGIVHGSDFGIPLLLKESLFQPISQKDQTVGDHVKLHGKSDLLVWSRKTWGSLHYIFC
jgi:hypothetical protein